MNSIQCFQCKHHYARLSDWRPCSMCDGKRFFCDKGHSVIGIRGLDDFIERVRHTAPVPQVDIRKGWQCPVCRRIYAPTHPCCNHCNNKLKDSE